MKRPEGFDKPAPQSESSASRGRGKNALPAEKPKKTRQQTADHDKSVQQLRIPDSVPAAASVTKNSSAVQAPIAIAGKEGSAAPRTVGGRLRLKRRETAPHVLAQRQLRRAARDRKRAEKSELRRFTRRARTRRYTLLSLAGLGLVLLGLIAVAVFSPILALRTVLVEGANRLDPVEIQAAVGSQEGTPLALLNFDTIQQDLSVFPLIRSYVTEIVPPDTLLINIVEREPIGSIMADGVFRLVDPAGITIQESAERIPGVPLIDIAGADASSPAFVAVTKVLLSLPEELRVRVEIASATTQDDVSFVLSGVGQRVVWGDASDSVRKAALLGSLIALHGDSSAGEFDVSAPSNGIFRPI